MPRLEHFVEVIQERLWTLAFETRRVVLEMLDVKVGIDGHNVELIGVIRIPGYVITTPQMGLWGRNNIELLPFRVRL